LSLQRLSCFGRDAGESADALRDRFDQRTPWAEMAAVAGAILGIGAARKKRGWLCARIDQFAQARTFLRAQEVLPPIDFQMRSVDPVHHGIAVQPRPNGVADVGAG